MKASTPRDVFAHLLLIITLYCTVGALINLLFAEINILFPEPHDYLEGSLSSIRWAVAMIIVSYPVYLLLSVFSTRQILRYASLADAWIRKWLLYLTLFLAALLLIGDLITLIFYFLNGELTVRFLLKIIVILVISASVFGYYFWDLRDWGRDHATKSRLFALIASIAVFVIIAGSFAVAGSPWHQRKVRMDSERIGHLQQLQSEIIQHWRMKGRIPDQIDALRDSISGFIPPVDPVTGSAYEYRRVSDLNFELCAVFQADGQLQGQSSYARPVYYEGIQQETNWDHGEGRVCFSRTIDPELYRKEPPIQ